MKVMSTPPGPGSGARTAARGRPIIVQDVAHVARFPPGVADGVPRVAHLQLGELLPMRVDGLGEAAQGPGPVSGGHPAPGGEGGPGVADRSSTSSREVCGTSATASSVAGLIMDVTARPRPGSEGTVSAGRAAR